VKRRFDICVVKIFDYSKKCGVIVLVYFLTVNSFNIRIGNRESILM